MLVADSKQGHPHLTSPLKGEEWCGASGAAKNNPPLEGKEWGGASDAAKNTLPLEGGGRAPKRAGGGESIKPFSKTTQIYAQTLRKNQTEAEKKLWYYLRGKQVGKKFRRQQPVGRYIVDFLCSDAKLVVEVDGGHHNGSSHDAKRDLFLRQEGYDVLRFWNHEVLENIEGVVLAITHHPHLTSPLKGEEWGGASDAAKNNLPFEGKEWGGASDAAKNTLPLEGKEWGGASDAAKNNLPLEGGGRAPKRAGGGEI